MQASTTKKMAPFDKHSYNNKSVFKASFNYNLTTLIYKDIVQLSGRESKIIHQIMAFLWLKKDSIYKPFKLLLMNDFLLIWRLLFQFKFPIFKKVIY